MQNISPYQTNAVKCGFAMGILSLERSDCFEPLSKVSGKSRRKKFTAHLDLLYIYCETKAQTHYAPEILHCTVFDFFK